MFASSLIAVGRARLGPDGLPAYGRFMQVDPVGYDDQTNLYAYVGDDPVNKTDPDGRTCVQNQDKSYACKVDNPGKANLPQIDKMNKQYTSAVNKLMFNPNKLERIGAAGGRSTVVSHKEIAEALIKANVTFGGPSPKFSSLGGGLATAFTNGHITDKLGVRITITTQGAAQTGNRLARTFAHEGIHGTTIDRAIRAFQPTNFNVAHQNMYKDAARRAIEDYD